MAQSPKSIRDYQRTMHALSKLAIDKALAPTVTIKDNEPTVTSPEASSAEASSPETPRSASPVKVSTTTRIIDLEAIVATLNAQLAAKTAETAALKEAVKDRDNDNKPKVEKGVWGWKPSPYPGVDLEFVRDGGPKSIIKKPTMRPDLLHTWSQKPSPK